jgi:FAD/FMN-containing dehydrogenase
LGLEIVLASGELLDLTSESRKDNTGYDLKQIFIGAEGTLGVITKININCVNIDRNRRVLFIRNKSFKDVLKTCFIARDCLSRDLAAFEFFDPFTYEMVLERKGKIFSDFFNSARDRKSNLKNNFLKN